VGGGVAAGRLAGGEAGAVGDLGADAAGPEGPPVVAVVVPGQQVPAAPGEDQPVRFGAAAAGGAVVVQVVEAQPLAVAMAAAIWARVSGSTVGTGPATGTVAARTASVRWRS
jgi:hypothetical protein